MHLYILSTIIAAVAASPLGDRLLPRDSPSPTCTSMSTKTTTVAGAEATLTGPFQMIANASGLDQDGCEYTNG